MQAVAVACGEGSSGEVVVLLIMHILNPVVMITVPLVLAAWGVRRWRLDWAIFGMGALTFILSQVLHIPFNQFLLNPALARLGEGVWAWVLIALLLGLSAGIFEESARYLVLKRVKNRVGSWPQGVLYGLGHGGIEAIILGALVFYALFQALALRGVALEGLVPATRLEATRIQLESYWGMAWYEPLWGALERLSALAFHVMASLLVLTAVRQNQARWWVASILSHALFNAVALVAVKAIGVAGTELILAGIGAGCVWVVLRLRPRLMIGPDGGSEARKGDRTVRPKVAVSQVEAEQLEDSKFL